MININQAKELYDASSRKYKMQCEIERDKCCALIREKLKEFECSYKNDIDKALSYSIESLNDSYEITAPFYYYYDEFRGICRQFKAATLSVSDFFDIIISFTDKIMDEYRTNGFTVTYHACGMEERRYIKFSGWVL